MTLRWELQKWLRGNGPTSWKAIMATGYDRTGTTLSVMVRAGAIRKRPDGLYEATDKDYLPPRRLRGLSINKVDWDAVRVMRYGLVNQDPNSIAEVAQLLDNLLERYGDAQPA